MITEYQEIDEPGPPPEVEAWLVEREKTWQSAGVLLDEFIERFQKGSFCKPYILDQFRPAHLLFIKPYHWHPVGESQFVEACSSEIESDLPILEILRSPPPRELVELWEAITATG